MVIVNHCGKFATNLRGVWKGAKTLFYSKIRANVQGEKTLFFAEKKTLFFCRKKDTSLWKKSRQ